MAKGKQGIPIKVGNKTYHIMLTMDVFLKAEQRSGRNWLHPRVYTQPNTQEVLTILHAGIQRDDPDVTIEDVASQVWPKDMVKLSDAIAEAYKEDVTDPDATKDPLAQTNAESSSDGQS